ALSGLQAEYEALIADELKNKSPEQMRIWRTEHIRCAENFISVVGDKPVTEVTEEDGLDYSQWWRERVAGGEAKANTANKYMGHLSRMLRTMRIRKRLKIPEIFKELKLREDTAKSRLPYPNEFIQHRLLGGSLLGMNEEARHVLYVMIETGLRLAEIANLQEH